LQWAAADNRLMAKAKQPKPPPGPDDVVRQEAGSYKSGDGRFEVRQSDANWFLVDLEQANEFGQELMHGPFGSLKQAKEALAGARDVKPLLRSLPRRPTTTPKQMSKPAPPKTWIDRLPDREASTVRSLIKALEREGLADADDVVRLHRDDRAPTIATKLLERRLAEILDDQPSEERDRITKVVQKVLKTLTVDGASMPSPAPRWALVELTDDAESAPRQMRPRL
jgi:hypothetical protein